MRFASISLAGFSLISSAAFGAGQSDQKTQLELGALVCKQDQQAAVSAVSLRDKGKSKEDLAKHLPTRGPDNNRMARLMYEILDDVFAYPEIKQFPYYTYRSEVCFRESERKQNPASFGVVAVDVLACQKKHGEEPSNGVIDCIREAVVKGANAK